ncbi:hypothetical protein TPA4_45 [Tsukamurella phage TPA4]|uniref:hypothetical protein n=1 Tax=Tsukamurella phage TPA4 TaxID=1647476 RepID=UPI0007B642A1|nr:hypothetical protein BH784_gp45 [Tsukamurella phage TPA4]AKJ72210.1 hypothetical protein TPA4_45 [Tsukamurella phage TPA4]
MSAPAPQDVVVDLTPIAGVIATLNEIRLEKAKLEDREKELTELVKAKLGSEGTVGQVNGETVVTWREAPRTTFDQKTFRADVGDDVADKYTKTTAVRSFRYTGGAK